MSELPVSVFFSSEPIIEQDMLDQNHRSAVGFDDCKLDVSTILLVVSAMRIYLHNQLYVLEMAFSSRFTSFLAAQLS